MEQRIFDIIFKGDEVTWQSLILDLVRVQNMDPWDIDVSKLSQDFIGMLRKMQQLDLRISGKVVLAAAILLKMKSNYLMERDIMNFDRLMHPDEYTEEALYEEPKRLDIDLSKVRLIPRTPQPRKRKVSIYELVEALKLALEVKNRRRQILDSIQIPLPEKQVDISIVIEKLYKNIEKILDIEGSLTFSQLIPSKKKEDIINAFIPVLHLSNQQKIDLYQEQHFGEIEITKPENSKRKQLDFINEALIESEKGRKNAVKKGKTSGKKLNKLSPEKIKERKEDWRYCFSAWGRSKIWKSIERHIKKTMSNENELRALNMQAQMISEQLNRIDSGLMEIEYLKNNLDEISSAKENTEILAPISSGIFGKAKLEKNNKLLVNVGNGIVVEKTISETKELLDERITEMNEAREKLLDSMQKIEDHLIKSEEK